MTKLPLVLLVGSLALGACESKDAKPSEAAKPVGDKAVPAVATPPVAPVAPPVATPVAYSPEALTKLVADSDACVVYLACDAYKPIVAFGAPAAPELVKVALDPAKKKAVRELAAHALIEIGAPEGGLALYEAAKTEKDVTLNHTLYEAAGATKSDEVFTAATKDLLGSERTLGISDQLAAIKPFGKKAFDWAAAGLAAEKKTTKQYRYAAVIRETATEAELAQVTELTGKTKDVMSKQHLASTAVKLGDAAQLEVLYAGLADKDEYVRADAGNMLADVADKVPAADKAKVTDLVTAAKGKDRGGLTSMGYDRVLKTLAK